MVTTTQHKHVGFNQTRYKGTCKISKGPYSFNPVINKYDKPEFMEPGKGYILGVENDCLLKANTETPPELPQEEITGKVTKRR